MSAPQHANPTGTQPGCGRPGRGWWGRHRLGGAPMSPEPPARRGPVDRRLWRRYPVFRWWLAVSVGVGLATTIGLVAQATFLAQAVSDAVARPGDHGALLGALARLALVTAARAVLAFAAEQAATGAARRTKTALRASAVRALSAAGTAVRGRRDTGDLAVTLGHGLDALDGYIGRYLPRIVLAGLAPVVLVAWIARLDWLSAGILMVTLVLLPVFMILVGQLTATRVAARWATLAALSGQFLDAVEGLATLRAFGRARAQRAAIARASDDLRGATLGTLRVALLSALVLETLAAVGTALVAVPLGLRLLSGAMTLTPALTILVLTPEVYLPLRRASAEFHASTDGTAALDAVFALLDPPGDQPSTHLPDRATRQDTRAETDVRVRPVKGEPTTEPARPTATTDRCPSSAHPLVIELRGLTVRYPGHQAPALGPLDLAVVPGEHLGVVGPSGAGKTTLVDVLTGLVRPDDGQLRVDGTSLTTADPAAWDAWRARLAWVPQRPTLLSGTVADNLRLGAPDADDAELWAALDAACLADVVAALPGGLDAAMAEHVESLSAGERQRLALARALARPRADVVLLDEPTAHLDPHTEAEVIARLRPLLAGRTLIVVTHRPRPLELAERTVTLTAGQTAPAGRFQPAGRLQQVAAGQTAAGHATPVLLP